MLRVLVALLVVPIMLVLLLAAVMDLHGGNLGAINSEIFELGMGPLILAIELVMVALFIPLVLLASRFVKVSAFCAAVVGLLSAFLPVLIAAVPVLIDTRLRLNFRVGVLADAYPFLGLGVVGGLLFWIIALHSNVVLCKLKRGS